jgi:hypothetical protein
MYRGLDVNGTATKPPPPEHTHVEHQASAKYTLYIPHLISDF